MLLKGTVLLLAVILMIVLISIFRKSSPAPTSPRRRNWEEHLEDLSLAELKQKLLDLEEMRSQAQKGFLQRRREEQKEVMEQVAQINKKMKLIEKIIGERSY